MKSKDASREKEKVRLKVQDKAEFAQFEEFVEFLVWWNYLRYSWLPFFILG